MHPTTKTPATAILLLTTLATASLSPRHVQLVTPAPYIWAEYGPTNPLNPDGSDFPCKIPQDSSSSYTINGTATLMTIGEPQTVAFAGWSVHGGGSCQFALTEGHAPTRDSAWKVIQSIEGGCPKANVAGNLEPGENPDTYTFTIPDDFEPGEYTWAWTWVNKIASAGEFYMNCAPISVSAAAGSSARVKERRQSSVSYPDLFLANVGDVGGGCTTDEAVAQQVAIRFPYPGGVVSWPNGQEELFQQACDGNPRNNGAVASGGASQSLLSATGGVEGGAPMSILPVGATVVPSYVPEPTASSEATSSNSVVVEPTPATTLDTVVSSATGSAAAATGASTLGGACTDGHLLCVDGTQFSTCTGGVWDAPQGLAAGTTCEGGEGVGLTIVNHF